MSRLIISLSLLFLPFAGMAQTKASTVQMGGEQIPELLSLVKGKRIALVAN